MAEGDAMQDRRGEERSDCALEGKIEFADRRVIPCLVKDLSTTGVRLMIDKDTEIPEQFDLLVPAVPEADQRFSVKLVWRRGVEIGGEFTSPSR